MFVTHLNITILKICFGSRILWYYQRRHKEGRVYLQNMHYQRSMLTLCTTSNPVVFHLLYSGFFERVSQLGHKRQERRRFSAFSVAEEQHSVSEERHFWMKNKGLLVVLLCWGPCNSRVLRVRWKLWRRITQHSSTHAVCTTKFVNCNSWRGFVYVLLGSCWWPSRVNVFKYCNAPFMLWTRKNGLMSWSHFYGPGCKNNANFCVMTRTVVVDV